MKNLRGSISEEIEKKIIKKDKKEDNFVYRFNYVNLDAKICINTMVSDGIPTFVLWDGENYKLCREFITPEGMTIKVPPINQPYYRDFYKSIVFPDTIIEDLVPSSIVDEKVTEFLKTWNSHPEDYYVIARNYIKFTWIHERFHIRPYLLVFGDYGTGKTEWGTYITGLCQNGLCVADISAPALARVLELTGSTIMLDELDKIDNRKDSEKMNTILRNGYLEDGTYIVAESEGKNFKPKSFKIDQPKVLVKRNTIRDDALASRVIPFKMTPRDKYIPDEMRRNDESWWHKQRKIEKLAIVNLLLKWRWQNIFLQDNVLIVPGLTARFNDTLMPLLKMGSPEDKITMINYMRKQEKAAIDTASDDQRIMIVKFIYQLSEAAKENGSWGTPAFKLSVIEIIDKAKEVLGQDMSEYDFKKGWNPRYVKRNLMDIGFEVETIRNKNYVKSESLGDLLPRLCEKYNIRPEPTEETPVDNSVDTDIDSTVDRNIIKEKEVELEL